MVLNKLSLKPRTVIGITINNYVNVYQVNESFKFLAVIFQGKFFAQNRIEIEQSSGRFDVERGLLQLLRNVVVENPAGDEPGPPVQGLLLLTGDNLQKHLKHFRKLFR